MGVQVSDQFVTIVIPRMVLKVPFVRVTEDLQARLTLRERDVFELLVTRKSHKEIAAILNISHRTAKFHASKIYRTLGVKDRLEFLSKYGKAQPEAQK